MNVIGRDIGEALDELYDQLQNRLRVEAERELNVEPFEQDALSKVRWADDAVTIQLHQGAPTHALPHVLAVALQHVRQRLDRYPDVRRPPGPQKDDAPSLRQALRELVLASEAEMQLASLELDQEWETEQRHAALKVMLHEPPKEWTEPDSGGGKFMSLQYARFANQHPLEMWEGLRTTFAEELPAVAESGESVLSVIRSTGWGTPGACLQSLIGARDQMALKDIALIEDRRSGELL